MYAPVTRAEAETLQPVNVPGGTPTERVDERSAEDAVPTEVGASTPEDRSARAHGAPGDGGPREVTRSARQLLLDHRYLVLSGALLLIVVQYTLRQRWAAGIDVWEHIAAARELGAHPLDPNHPLFPVDRPHQLFSPYHLVLGLVSRFTGLSILTVFGLAGIGNVVLLLVGLRMFTRRLFGPRHVDFWALLFVLFLWGSDPWFFSGFLHFNVFPWVMPYPSTFAKGLVLVGLAVHLRGLDPGDRRALAGTVGIGAVLLVVHPVDALFFFVGIGALALTRPSERRRVSLAVTGLAIAISAVLALAWPYFSLYDLLFGAANESYRAGLASADRDMYRDVLGRAWPALIAVPFVVRRMRRYENDPLLLMLLGLLVLYAYGWRFEEWAYGRVIAAIMVVIAVILADELTGAAEEAVAAGDLGRRPLTWIQCSAVGLVAVGMFQVRHGFVMLPEAVVRRLPQGSVQTLLDVGPASEFSFLSRYTSDGEFVIADVYRSMEAAAFGAKVIGVSVPEAFVDAGGRYVDQARFFDKGATEAVRREIIAKYDASYLLLGQYGFSNEPENYRAMQALGTVIHSNNRYVLVDLRQPPAPVGG